MSRPSFQLGFHYKTGTSRGVRFIFRVSNVEVDMGHLRPSFFLLLLLGFLCVANSNPISGLFGKSDDAKAVEEEKDVKDAAAATTTTTTTAATPTAAATSAPCSGLSGFFHLCDKKNEQTEPPKKVKRDASEEDDSDSDSDSYSDEYEEKNETSTSSNSEAEVEKRQVGDPEAPVLGEVPSVLEDAMRVPETSDEPEEEDGGVKRRQVEDSDEKEEEDEEEDLEETSRRRRDCRDGNGEYLKDCRRRRRKREYVPACFGAHCIKKSSEAPETAKTTD